jgi:hypothetical protein
MCTLLDQFDEHDGKCLSVIRIAVDYRAQNNGWTTDNDQSKTEV